MVTNLATIDICHVIHQDESVYHQQVIIDDTTFITYICPGHQVRESRECGWHCPWWRSSRWRSSSRLCASTFSVFVSRTPDWSALSLSPHWWKSCGVGQLSGCSSSKSPVTGKLCHEFYRKRSARSPPSVEWCPSFDPVGGRARCHLAVRGEWHPWHCSRCREVYPRGPPPVAIRQNPRISDLIFARTVQCHRVCTRVRWLSFPAW